MLVNFGKINFLLVSLPKKQNTSQLATYQNNKTLDTNDFWNRTTARRRRVIWYMSVFELQHGRDYLLPENLRL